MTEYRQLPNHDLQIQDDNNRFTIVLVEPKSSLNTGSILRAMDNFGFKKLRLVNPRNFNVNEICTTACWAKEQISTIEIFDSLANAIADQNDCIGFGASYGRNRISHVSISTWLEEKQQSNNLKTALVFGSEDQGLSNDDIRLLRLLIRIPTSSVNPSLNLAQSVTLVLYELSKSAWPDNSSESIQAAVGNDYMQLEQKVDIIMHLSKFKNEHSSKDVPRVIHSLLRRLQLDKRELAIVLGLSAKVINQLIGKNDNSN